MRKRFVALPPLVTLVMCNAVHTVPDALRCADAVSLRCGHKTTIGQRGRQYCGHFVYRVHLCGVWHTHIMHVLDETAAGPDGRFHQHNSSKIVQ
jgi:hypothetical protein